MSAENVVTTGPVQREDRRGRSRTPLRIIMAALFLISALWLVDLYSDPGWSKIQSFLVGYFVGTFVMDWIRQRADREVPAPAVGQRTLT